MAKFCDVQKFKDAYEHKVGIQFDNAIHEMEKEEFCADVIPIPKGATNGDVIKAMFPNVEFNRGDYGISTCFMKMNNDVGFASLYETWWNAPYKKGTE